MNKVLRGFSRRIIVSATLFAVGGCVEPSDESAENVDVMNEDVAASEAEIRGGTAADPWSRARTASLLYCTATVIGPRHLLTAAHCTPSVGDKAYFYTSTDLDYVPVDLTTERVVDAVSFRPGVNAAAGDYTDVNGDFADIAVVRLSSNVPSTSQVATMAWVYPAGGDDWGIKVGSGRHEGASNGDEDLRSVPDLTYSDNDSDGHFLTENEQSDSGDSGGAFFYSNRALGVLYGSVFEWEYRNKYTSVQKHLPWILTVMAYSFPGTVRSGVVVNGASAGTAHASTSRECSYICDKTSSCDAFNFIPSNVTAPCQLKSSNTGTSSLSGATSGVK